MGNKRRANGEVKGSGKSKTGTSNGKPLLEEIHALGGDKDDLELINGVDSASDDGYTAANNGKQNYNPNQDEELQGLLQQLGGQEEPEERPNGKGRSKLPKDDLKSSPRLQSSNKYVSVVHKAAQGADSQFKASRRERGRAKGSYLVEPRSDWHAIEIDDIASREGDLRHLPRNLLDALSEHANQLLDRENEEYSAQSTRAGPSRRFMSTIMSSGTLSDKISALTLSFQESPIHNTKAFENLIGLSAKRSRAQAVIAVGAVKDLLGQGSLLPSDRRLVNFSEQPGLLTAFQSRSMWTKGQPLPGGLTEVHLVLWAFEDWLKGQYFEFLKILESWCGDEVEYARGRAVGYVWELLKEKPEQEANLLRLLVNKLGDSANKVASKTSHLLLQLQISHPLMKSIVVSSIESNFLFRAGQGLHAQYYAVITLNQTILSARDNGVADKLLEIYFSLFVGLLKQTQKAEEKEAEEAKIQLNSKGDIQGGGAPRGKKPSKKQRLRNQRMEATKSKDEQLVDKTISAVLTGVNRALPFSNVESTAFTDHLNTLFRITHSTNFNASIQALVLIQRLVVILKSSEHRFYRTLYESLLDPRLVTSSKHTMYLNLLFLSLKSDLNVKRVKAFVKRLVQICHMHLPPFICGVLFMLRRLEETFPSLETLVTEPPFHEEDEMEKFMDVVEDGTATVESIEEQLPPSEGYDGRKRDPEYSNADKTCLWELRPFVQHYHPSVALFASAQLQQQSAPEQPTMSSHSLTHFLDQFINRNVKAKHIKSKGDSIMQPLNGATSSGILLSSQPADMDIPFNSEAFRNKKVEEVAADQVFFHKYFNSLPKSKTRQKKKKNKDAAEDGDSENEDEIWKALVQSRPEVEGPGADDDDEGFSDLEAMSDDEDLDISDQDADLSAGSGPEEEPDASDMEIDLDIDDGAILDSDDDAAIELDGFVDADASEEEVDERAEKKKKRRKLKNLPTFASADDYAALLDQEEKESF
ncbi:MAG: hypothetical protein M1814_006945 [Vezdaea aestivalis]|nr:MAG: hypothetical protein M1814_006945 [Vezdaea aestivalis]